MNLSVVTGVFSRANLFQHVAAIADIKSLVWKTATLSRYSSVFSTVYLPRQDSICVMFPRISSGCNLIECRYEPETETVGDDLKQ